MTSTAFLRRGFCAWGLVQMQPVDPAFLFDIGDQCRGLSRLSPNLERFDSWMILEKAVSAIRCLVYQSIYSPHFRVPLLTAAEGVTNACHQAMGILFPGEGEGKDLTLWEINPIQSAYSKFETILISELQTITCFLINKKGGFDVSLMVNSGRSFFSNDLQAKVPEAVPDLEQAMRCMAFEVPTAAGFHLHRANESVLRVYWDHVTDRKPRPRRNNMGAYLDALNKLGVGNESVKAHLKSIKDFHRNPLMHPEESLDDMDQAVDLMSAIRCAIGYMLKEIPMPLTASQVLLGEA